MSRRIHQTVSSATFQKSIQYHLCVGCHLGWQSGHLSLKQILLENKGQKERDGGGLGLWRGRGVRIVTTILSTTATDCPHLQTGKYQVGAEGQKGNCIAFAGNLQLLDLIELDAFELIIKDKQVL